MEWSSFLRHRVQEILALNRTEPTSRVRLTELAKEVS